jgi:ferredoxin-NADP reductase
MKLIDRLLNNITMYRLVVYVLAAISALGLAFSFAGRLSSSPTSLIVSLSLILSSAYVTDRLFGRVYNVPTNMESSLITALILFLILAPIDSTASAFNLVLAGAISSASKFIIAVNGKHLFNPAAFAAAAMSLTGLHPVTWWVGSSALWPFTLVLGFAVVWKIRRVPLFAVFAVTCIVVQVVIFMLANQPFATNLKHALFASPLIFLATIMLTEPATMPPRRNMQMLFGALVALLYVTGWELGPIVIYPEVALLVGNIFAYIVSPKFRVRLQLKEVQRISDRVYDYVFEPERSFNFIPGQYMEWTLPNVPYDSRGNRRTFTVASSPTESEVHLGLKYYDPASTYKASFFNLKPGDTIYASQLAGDFTLTGNEHKKLAFIAGGIGITPFRSMVKYLTDNNLQSDIVLLYVVGKAEEFAYVKLLLEAATAGIKTIPIVTDLSHRSSGVITAKLRPELISELIPDYAERMFYISGSNAIVDATQDYLHELGVSRRNILTDHFSGY